MNFKWFGYATLFIILAMFAENGSAGIMGKDECRRRCADEYRECKKTETAASAVDDISCHELREMCLERCDNVAGYVDCKEKCGDDADCLKNCKENFSNNVHDYRPYLERRNKGKE